MKKASGSLYGLAFGDALGRPTEFQDYESIIAEYGAGGPRHLIGEPALVTDDTQMALAVGEAIRATGTLTPAGFAPQLRAAFLAWAVSPDNNRAPGTTCLRACGNLSDGRPWQDATQIHSKGCGANMRVTPIGLVPGLADEVRAGAAQLQAALTHGHPTALAASELTAFAVCVLAAGDDPRSLLSTLRRRCDNQRTTYHTRWLGDLWTRGEAASPVDYIARGWDECAAALDRVAAGLAAGPLDGDPCMVTGAGWIAEEALATALFCYLLTPDEPVTAIARGAASSGDSDSIACLAGAFAGAALGLAAWPARWIEQIEYTDRLAALGTAWN